MTRTQLKKERRAVKAKNALKCITHNFDMEFALDILAFTVLVAVVVLAFFLDGIMGLVPENLFAFYMLLALYLVIYIIHKFTIMKENEH